MELLVFDPKKLAWFLSVLQRGLLNAAAQARVCVKFVILQSKACPPLSPTDLGPK